MTNHLDKMLDMKALDALKAHIEAKQSDKIVGLSCTTRELTLVCKKQDIRAVLKFLRDDKQCAFRVLVDVCGVDYPERETRFDVVYHLLSIEKNLRIRVKVQVADGDTVPSVVELFSSANWYERECYDMFGIRFEDHPDLRRILSDYDFDGHPLRKDFPVVGKVEVYYDTEEKRVAYKPVDMPQAFRTFTSPSKWEAMTGNVGLAEDPNLFDESDFQETSTEDAAQRDLEKQLMG